MPTYCIGDIQGCYDDLRRLIDIAGIDILRDNLWFVGDLVNKGPKSLQVLRFIKNLPNRIIVLGNHDFYLICLHLIKKRPIKKTGRILDPNGEVYLKIDHTLDEVLVADDCDELISWLCQQKLFYYSEKYNCAVAHAGIYPLWNLHEAEKYANQVCSVLSKGDQWDLFRDLYSDSQNVWNDHLLKSDIDRYIFTINCFTRMRFCDINCVLNFKYKCGIGSQPSYLIPWFEYPSRKIKNVDIVFGHWSALRENISLEAKDICVVKRFDNYSVYPIDTGCVWGNYLTAIRLDDKKIFSVKNTDT